MPVIGWLGSDSREQDFRVAPFRQGLRQSGYIEGQNLVIEYRWAEGQFDRLPALAADLVRRQVSGLRLTAFWRHALPKRRPRRFRLSSRWRPTRSSLDWSPASTDLAAI
jgi:hypothetical protein